MLADMQRVIPRGGSPLSAPACDGSQTNGVGRLKGAHFHKALPKAVITSLLYLAPRSRKGWHRL